MSGRTNVIATTFRRKRLRSRALPVIGADRAGGGEILERPKAPPRPTLPPLTPILIKLDENRPHTTLKFGHFGSGAGFDAPSISALASRNKTWAMIQSPQLKPRSPLPSFGSFVTKLKSGMWPVFIE